MKKLHLVVKVLLIIGALNWGLIGFFQYDLISNLLGCVVSTGARVVYGIIGLAGLYALACLIRRCCHCRGSGCHCASSCSCGHCSCGPNCKCGNGKNCQK